MEINNIPEALTLPLRLSLISCLVDGQKTFTEMKNITKGSDGNISVQLSKLQKWGFIESEKCKLNNYSQTIYTITEFGLNNLEDYIALLEDIIQSSIYKKS
jgi:DNA-binding PadR family transcriptional regulator